MFSAAHDCNLVTLSYRHLPNITTAYTFQYCIYNCHWKSLPVTCEDKYIEMCNIVIQSAISQDSLIGAGLQFATNL